MSDEKEKKGINKQKDEKVYQCFCSKKYNSYAGLYLHLKSKHQAAFSLYKNMKLSKLLIKQLQTDSKTIFKLKEPIENIKQSRVQQKQQIGQELINKSTKEKDKNINTSKQKELHSQSQKHFSPLNNQNSQFNNNKNVELANGSEQYYNLINPNFNIQTKPLFHLPYSPFSYPQLIYHQNHLQPPNHQQSLHYQQLYQSQPNLYTCQYLPFNNFMLPPLNYQINSNPNYYHYLNNNDQIETSQTKIINHKDFSFIKSQHNANSPISYKRFPTNSLPSNHQLNHQQNHSS